MSTQLWQAINYRTPVKYFLNTYIREYDLSKANVNALFYKGRITREELNAYLEMPKQQREIEIGLWIKRDSTIYKDIQAGIIEAKRRLVESNDLDDFDIVTVKNDAMFIVGKDLRVTEFPPFRFSVKNVYTVYLNLMDLEIYYGDSVNPVTGFIDTNLDVKGISDKKLEWHRGGILDLICDVCYKLQRDAPRNVLAWMSYMYEKFIHRELPKEFYRAFDSESMYTLQLPTGSGAVGEITESDKWYVDINRNLGIMRDLMGIVTDIYHRQIRRNF